MSERLRAPPNADPEVRRCLADLVRSYPVIADANTAHATANFAQVNTALDALGAKINEIIAQQKWKNFMDKG